MTHTSLPWPDNFLREVFADEQRPDEIVKALPSNVHLLALYLLSEIDRAKDKNYTELVVAYFRDGLTLQKIGEKYGKSRERIRQKLSKALHLLRHPARLNVIRQGLYSWHITETQKAVNRAVDETEKKTELEHLENRTTELTEMLKAERKNLQTSIRTKPQSVKPGTDLSQQNLRLVNIIDLDGFSVRAKNALKSAGIQTIHDLTQYTWDGIAKLPNIGQATVHNIRLVLNHYCLTLPTNQEMFNH